MTGNQDVVTEVVDFESNSSIKEFCKRFITKFGRLDLLINNAAIAPEQR